MTGDGLPIGATNLHIGAQQLAEKVKIVGVIEEKYPSGGFA